MCQDRKVLLTEAILHGRECEEFQEGAKFKVQGTRGECAGRWAPDHERSRPPLRTRTRLMGYQN